MGNFAIGLIAQIFNLFMGTMGGAWNMLKGVMGDAYQAVTQYNQRGISFARQLGMNAREAQAYTEVLIARAKDLGKAYGISAEQVFELQENLAASTGKAMMLNNQEAERMVQINKMVGSNVANEFTSEIMNKMGGQLSTVQGAVSKAYATGAKSGLDAAKFSEKVAKNLSMANKLSFRDGVNGIIKMTALSEKLGFNLQSVEQAASNFMDIDKSIENAAHLQMLGGAAGAYGGNPLEMAYEANYDPEAFTERMTNMLKGLATFDKKTGMAKVGGMNMNIAREIAKGLGISADEAVNIAKKQAEISYKKNAYGASLGNFSTEQQDFILNKSYVDTDTGHLMMNDVNGNAVDISNGELNEEIIKELQKFDNMSDKELMETQARSLTSIDEQIKGFQTSFTATVAEPIIKNIGVVQGAINQIGEWMVSDIGPKIAKFIETGLKWLEDHKDAITKILKFGEDLVSGTLGFIVDHLGTIITIVGAIAAAKMVWGFGRNTYKLGRNIRRAFGGGRRGSPARAATSRLGISGFFKELKAGFQLSRAEGSGRIASFFKSFKLFGEMHMPKFTNFIKSIGNAGKSISSAVGKFAKTASKAFTKAASGISKAAKGISKVATKVGSKVGGAAKGVGKVLTKVGGKALTKVGGAALAGVTSLGLAGLDVSDIRKQMDELTKSYKEGKVSQDEYNKKMRELSNQKNEAIGSGVGGVVGGALGSLLDEFLGPFGTIIGAMVGDAIGGFVGGVWNNISNTVSDFWNGTVRNLAESMFGKAGTAVVDAIGSFVDGYTNGVGVVLETILSGIGDFLGGAWDGIKTIFGGTWDGIVKIFHGDLTGFFDIIVAQAKGTWKIISSTVIGVWKVVTAPFLGLWEIFKGFGNAMVDLWGGVVAVYNNVAEGISTAWDATVGAFSAVGQWIQEKWNGAVDAIGSVFTSIGEFFRPVVDVANGIFTAIGNAWSTVTSFVQGIFDGVASAWNSVIGFFRRVGEGIAKAWSAVCDAVGNLNPIKWVEKGLDALGDLVGFAEGGVVGGDSPTGDKIMARLNSGEMVLNKDQQNMLFGLFSKSTSLLSDLFSFNPFSILTNSNDVKAKPVGEKEYIYTPNGNSNNGVTELTVRDININVNGTIKLDAGNFAKNLDINQLLNDSSFVSSLKEIIKSSINNDMNGGRFMNDNATLRGSLGTTTYWGR